MRFITVSEEFFKLCGDDPEILHKGTKRPHLLVVSLSYKGERWRFAVPFRSNISPATPKTDYFPLPPREATKPKHRHGLHYTKMFPITKQYQEKFWVGNKASYMLYHDIINRNEKRIISECQAYLDRYAKGFYPKFSVDIDGIIKKLTKE